MSGAVEVYSPIENLPESPMVITTEQARQACEAIYEARDIIISNATIETATEGLRRAKAIEAYVSNKLAKDAAKRAARVLEAAVGQALGVAVNGGDRRSDQLPREATETAVKPQDAYRFRRMAAHRAVWWPDLEEKALSRKQVLSLIDEALRPVPDGAGDAYIVEGEACEWLETSPMADLLLTDPPYSTDVDDVAVFANSWLPLALSRVKHTGRAFVFIGAYAPELSAYTSIKLPDGWTWGVPHAWCYRNAIGPTPEMDFVRNWQMMLTIKGPEARPLQSDRITDLLAGYVENAPDGRQGVKHHRWEKPLPLIERLVTLSTEVGEMIIDPFSGSGTSLIAARNLGRNAHGCDMDPDAVSICVERGCYEG